MTANNTTLTGLKTSLASAAVKVETQRENIRTAIKAAATAVAGVDDDSTDSEVKAAEDAIADAKTAIAAATDVGTSGERDRRE